MGGLVRIVRRNGLCVPGRGRERCNERRQDTVALIYLCVKYKAKNNSKMQKIGDFNMRVKRIRWVFFTSLWSQPAGSLKALAD